MEAENTPQEETLHEVSIADLLRDTRYQVRKKLDTGRVSSYRSSYAAEVDLGPIKVAHVRHALVLVDGWHRVAALESLGVDTVQAVVVKATEQEALWIAAQANLTHGLPLKSSEMRMVFRSYMRSGRYKQGRRSFKSYREIAVELGGSRHFTTIRNWMKKDFPKIAARYSSEDTPMNTGGLTPVPVMGTFKDTSRTAINDALNAFRNVEDPVDRGHLIGLVEEALQTMRDGGGWITPEDAFTDADPYE